MDSITRKSINPDLFLIKKELILKKIRLSSIELDLFLEIIHEITL
jgi:hypothetical protein